MRISAFEKSEPSALNTCEKFSNVSALFSYIKSLRADFREFLPAHQQRRSRCEEEEEEEEKGFRV